MNTAAENMLPDSPPAGPGTDVLETIRARIAADPEHAPRLDELAVLAALSPSQLTRSFRQRFGLSPREYAQSLRLDQFRQSLRDGEDVTDAVYAAGFGSSSRVYENIGRHLGMTPGSYRRGGAGETIRYTVVESPLGHLLVATTTRGICAVTLGDDAEALAEQLRVEFPQATLERIDAGADEWISTVIARVSHTLQLPASGDANARVPADIRATAFQWQVWQTLMRIPEGETRSYSDVAIAVGNPRAVRAVARACASNKLALIVPCHRVIREDGSLGGYRWGLPLKTSLLDAEKSRARASV